MNTAVIVMDLQEGTVGKHHLPFFHYKDDLLKKANRIIEHSKGKTIVYIRTVMKSGGIYKIIPVKMQPNQPAAQLAEGLKVISGHIYDKYTGNAFTNPELHKFLQSKKIKHIEIFGIDGSGCVYKTSRGAIDHGYTVKVLTEATDSTSRVMMKSKLKKLAKRGAEIV